MVGSAVVAAIILARTPDFAPGLGIATIGVTAIVFPVLALRPRADRARAQLVAVSLGLAMVLAGPAAYAADSMTTAYAGGDPAAGPTAEPVDVRSGPGAFPGAPFDGGGVAGQPPAGPDGAPGGSAMGAGGLGASLDTATIDVLVASQGTATWLVAVSDASTAAQLELATLRPVMAMGGFSGSDDALSLARLQALVSSGDLRFIVLGGSRRGPSAEATSAGDITAWVASACTVLAVDGAPTTVYDCAGAG
jgi:hypothetical protein